MTRIVSPFAGNPAPASILVNVSSLVTAYYAEHPDPSVAAERVAFGTSGHRGSAFERTFNEAHILAITQAICSYRRAREIEGPLFMGMDHHALSEPAFARLLSGRRPAVHVRVAGAGHEGAVGCVQQDKSNYDRHIRAELMF
jgi:hypothetical protein